MQLSGCHVWLTSFVLTHHYTCWNAWSNLNSETSFTVSKAEKLKLSQLLFYCVNHLFLRFCSNTPIFQSFFSTFMFQSPYWFFFFLCLLVDLCFIICWNSHNYPSFDHCPANCKFRLGFSVHCHITSIVQQLSCIYYIFFCITSAGSESAPYLCL